MALSRKQMREIKAKLSNTNPSSLQAIKKASSQSKHVSKKKIIKDENYSSRTSIIRYSFKPNQLVEVSFLGEKIIGLIVSDFEYFSKRVEKNCFFVLIKSTVKQFDGRYIRQI